jgi:hypothetical protein
MGLPGRYSRELGMKWRVMLELVGPGGVVGVIEIGRRAAVAEYAPQMIGLTLEEAGLVWGCLCQGNFIMCVPDFERQCDGQRTPASIALHPAP